MNSIGVQQRLAGCGAVAGAMFLLFAGAAHADLVISSAATANMRCGNSICRATAPNAVLNVRQLKAMLSAGSATVSTAERAGPNIVINAALTWASAHSLTLDAYTSIAVNAPVTVVGTGGLSIITNDGGYNGTLWVGQKANVSFWSTANKLAINRIAYKLVDSIQSLAAAVKAHPAGFFALSNSYDASVDGTYAAAPVDILKGTLEGLGNTISNLSIKAPKGGDLGLTAVIEAPAQIENLKLKHATIVALEPGTAAGLVGLDLAGTLFNDSVSGTVVVPGNSGAGLLAGGAEGALIANSHASGRVNGRTAGGLVGGTSIGFGVTYILNSSSTASVAGPANQVYDTVGGLLGSADAMVIENSWSSGDVVGHLSARAGGLVGDSICPIITASFATGAVSGGSRAAIGGLVGASGAVLGGCGEISGSYATGNVKGGGNSREGGLVGDCDAPLINDFATGSVSGGPGAWVGGLAGAARGGGMDQVWAGGNVAGGSVTGGLVGFSDAVPIVYGGAGIANAYATGSVTGSANGDVGGLIGQNGNTVSTAYAAGAVIANGAHYAGGLVGQDLGPPQYRFFSYVYWDLTTSGIGDPAQGAGNVSNDPGVIGKSDTNLKSHLPSGFSGRVWAQSPEINGGLPYLLGTSRATADRAKFRCLPGLPAKVASLCRAVAR